MDGLLGFLFIATIAFFPLHEYWVRQASRDQQERLRRQTFGEDAIKYGGLCWVLILFLSALGA